MSQVKWETFQDPPRWVMLIPLFCIPVMLVGGLLLISANNVAGLAAETLQPDGVQHYQVERDLHIAIGLPVFAIGFLSFAAWFVWFCLKHPRPPAPDKNGNKKRKQARKNARRRTR